MVSFKSILVPVDFGEASQHALEVAVDLAKQYRGSVTLVHTWEVPVYAYSGMEFAAVDLLTPIQEAAQQRLDEMLTEVKKTIPDAKAILKRGAPWREILATIEETRPDLVVMGTHGRRGVGRVVLGSVAEKVVRTSPAPVMTIGAGAAHT
jgi:nucleotide-binding universal stress UspA family protein